MFSLNNICILCLSDTKNLKNAATKDGDGCLVEDKLCSFLSGKIHFKKNIPKYVCTNCLKKLNKVHRFKRKCLRNIATVNNYLELLTTNNQAFKKLLIDLNDKNDEFRRNIQIEIKKEIEDDVEMTEMTCLLFAEANQIEVKTESAEEEFDNNINNNNKYVNNNIFDVHVENDVNYSKDINHDLDEQKVISEDDSYCPNLDYRSSKEAGSSIKRIKLSEPTEKISCEASEDFFVQKETNLKCLICFEPFIDDNSLREHLINHEKNDKQKDISDKTENLDEQKVQPEMTAQEKNPMPQKSFLKRYLLLLKQKNPETEQQTNTETQESLFKCQVCNTEFNEEWMLNLHSIQHIQIKLNEWSEEEESDDQSGENTEESKDDLGNREGFMQTENGRYKCIVCFRPYLMINNLRYHIFVKHKDAVQCKECNKMLRNQEKLTIHERKHSFERPFRCDICHRGFIDSAAAERHKKIHSDDLEYKCDQCEKKFSTKDLLKCHQTSVHTKSYCFVCEICGKGFKKKNNFTEHLDVHKGKKSYECDTCFKKYSSAGNLRVHKFKHSGETHFQCEICDKKFTLHVQLKTHKFNAHSEEKPFKCIECNKAFKTKTQVKRHMRTHTGSKPFKCKICSKKMGSLIGFERHMMVHEGIKPYKCKKCDYATVNTANLKLHERVHDKVKPFKCDKCDYSTGNRSNLKVHAKQHEKRDKKGTRKSKNSIIDEIHQETIIVNKIELSEENGTEKIKLEEILIKKSDEFVDKKDC